MSSGERLFAGVAAEVLTKGWARLRGLLDRTAAGRLREEMLMLVNADAADERCLYFYAQPSASDGRCLVRIERVWDSLPSLRGDPGRLLYQTAEACLGEPACLFKDKVNLRWPGSAGYAPHQDTAAGWLDYAKRFISLEVFVHFSGRETGGFEIVSRHHRDGRFDNTCGEMDLARFERLEPELIEFEAGDLLVLDGEAPHRTLPNVSNQCVMHLIFTSGRVNGGS